jgi:hypothetical protein
MNFSVSPVHRFFSRSVNREKELNDSMQQKPLSLLALCAKFSAQKHSTYKIQHLKYSFHHAFIALI